MTQKKIVSYKATIDKQVYPAVVVLRNRGFEPKFSCSGHGGEGYIKFRKVLRKPQKCAIGTILKDKGFRALRWKDQRGLPKRVAASSVVTFYVPRKKDA
jgi:hypothetical protein